MGKADVSTSVFVIVNCALSLLLKKINSLLFHYSSISKFPQEKFIHRLVLLRLKNKGLKRQYKKPVFFSFIAT